MDWSDNHADYDSFRSNEMKDVVRVLANVKKPGTHGDVFCVTKRFVHGYENTVSDIRELRAGRANESQESGAVNDETRSVELQAVFDLENSALHYILGAGYCEQAAAAKIGHMLFYERYKFTSAHEQPDAEGATVTQLMEVTAELLSIRCFG